MAQSGEQITVAITSAAARHGIEVRVTGPSTMPYVSFSGDVGWVIAKQWASMMADRGVYVNPSHNWFMSTALDDTAINRVHEAVEGAFSSLAGISLSR